jgi:hypothetical protein
MSDARVLLQKAVELVERREYGASLQMNDQALLSFQEAGDVDGFAECYAMRGHIFRHLYRETGFEAYGKCALHCAQLGVSLATEQGRGVNLINLAKAQELSGERELAKKSYLESSAIFAQV